MYFSLDGLLLQILSNDIAILGTIFAYGVTSSGKTHTMHVSFSYLSFLHFLSFCVLGIDMEHLALGFFNGIGKINNLRT